MNELTIDSILAMTQAEMVARMRAPAAERAPFIRVAAEAGLAEAQAIYGQMLLDGEGVACDSRAAVGWFDRAARQGNPMAINMMGRCYDQGWGVPIDKVRAAEWFKVAADHGLDWGLYNYGSALAVGAGVERDPVQALTLFRRAAAMGHAKSTNFVGTFYEDGLAVERDLDEAARCYAIAAEGGDFRGQFNHARMLAMSGAVAEALPWIRRSAQAATPGFALRAREHLDASPIDALRDAAPLFATR